MSMGAKVLLMELRERTSAKGTRYLSGWLGKASVVAFLDREAAEPTWQVFVSTPAPRPGDNTDRTPSRQRRQSCRRSSELAPGDLDDRLDDL